MILKMHTNYVLILISAQGGLLEPPHRYSRQPVARPRVPCRGGTRFAGEFNRPKFRGFYHQKMQGKMQTLDDFIVNLW